jgi:hypothetical protein
MVLRRNSYAAQTAKVASANSRALRNRSSAPESRPQAPPARSSIRGRDGGGSFEERAPDRPTPQQGPKIDLFKPVRDFVKPVDDWLQRESVASAERANDFWGSLTGSVAKGQEMAQESNTITGSAIMGDKKRFDETVTKIKDREQKFADDKAAEDDLKFSNATAVRVRELTPDEWNALPLDQQQAITANFAAYQAGIADRRAGGTSNTDAVMEQFGIDTDKVQAEDFISGEAITREEDINNQGLEGALPRLQVFEMFKQSPTFDNPALTDMLASGQDFISSLGRSGVLDPQVAGLAGVQTPAAQQVQELLGDDLQYLDQTFKGMSKRAVWDLLQVDEQANADMKADLDLWKSRVNPTLLKQYFLDTYPEMDDPNYFSRDEFATNWLN